MNINSSKDLYWTGLTNFLFYKNILFILKVKIKMSQLLVAYETIIIENLVEHQQ